MASMRGEMSQMVAECPNADAVRHYDRCGVISRPAGAVLLLLSVNICVMLPISTSQWAPLTCSSSPIF